MDENSVTALISLDLSKDFDSINHTVLLIKLSNIGASPSVVNMDVCRRFQDITICCSGRSRLLKQQLEEDLFLVAKCCSENQLLINLGKTKYKLIGMSINFLNKTITPVSFAKDLGMTLDPI